MLNQPSPPKKTLVNFLLVCLSRRFFFRRNHIQTNERCVQAGTDALKWFTAAINYIIIQKAKFLLQPIRFPSFQAHLQQFIFFVVRFCWQKNSGMGCLKHNL